MQARWLQGAFCFILILALAGCLQTTPTPTPVPSIQAGPSARALPLAVRLGDTIESEYTMTVGSVVVETTEKAVAVKAGLPGAEFRNFTPLRFIVGYNDVIPSIEKTVQGMHVGDNRVVQVAPQDGFGMPLKDKIKTAPRASFEGAALEEGYLVFGPDGVPVGKVVSLNDTDVVLDMNHPLAGKILTLNITVRRIEPPKRT